MPLPPRAASYIMLFLLRASLVFLAVSGGAMPWRRKSLLSVLPFLATDPSPMCSHQFGVRTACGCLLLPISIQGWRATADDFMLRLLAYFRKGFDFFYNHTACLTTSSSSPISFLVLPAFAFSSRLFD
jgi:hypothetical protein